MFLGQTGARRSQDGRVDCTGMLAALQSTVPSVPSAQKKLKMVLFACDTSLGSAYNISLVMEAARVRWTITSLCIKDELSFGFLRSNGCFNDK